MRRFVLVGALAALGSAQPPMGDELGFEGTQRATGLRGWFEQPSGIAFADSEVVHSGRYSARLEGRAGAPLIMRLFPIDFDGEFVELKAFVRTENVAGGVYLWMRQDGQVRSIAAAQSQPVKGTTEWTEYSVRIPILATGNQVYYGVFIQGAGRAWIDDMQLLVDGKPLAEAQARDFSPINPAIPN